MSSSIDITRRIDTLSHILQSVSESLLFKGRPGDPRYGDHVVISKGSLSQLNSKNSIFGLFGCPDDLGVTKNKGRGGARLGPDSIRKALYKIVSPFTNEHLQTSLFWDAGNVIVDPKTITQTHKHARMASCELAAHADYVIALGGGHDFAAPNFLGWVDGVRSQSANLKKTIGLINIDPHLDVREFDNGEPHSGTPFREILESKTILGSNFYEFGARQNRNASSHFDFCKSHSVNVHYLEDLLRQSVVLEKFKAAADSLSKSCDHMGVTFDMDACFECEGTSAAPVIGFSAWQMIEMARIAGEVSKVGYMEIAEVAPSLDTNDRSSRIAAEMIDAFVRAKLKQPIQG
jgi:formiminoglutamase